MKTTHPIGNEIVTSVKGHGKGYVFNSADFCGSGNNRAAVDKALSRLARQGVICRLAHGLYLYPRVDLRLGGVLSAPPDMVAQAVARKTNSRVIPTGATAANALGLSTQVPAKAVYITDGPARMVRYGGQTITFRHAAPRTMAVSGRTSAVVFQALRYMGRGRVPDATAAQIGRVLSAKDKRVLKKDMRYAAAWMRPIISRIVGETESV